MRDVHWKTKIDDLRSKAADVMSTPLAPEATVSARQAAAILSGICGMIARLFSVDEMQLTCAQLARLEPFSFERLPTDHTGRVTEPMSLLAAVSRSIRPLSGEANLRSALAFWASEDDPAVWNQIAA